MPLLGSRGGASARGFGRFGLSLLFSFIDSFDRANGALGTSSDGKAAWTVQRGNFTISSNRASSSNTDNSIATVSMASSTITNAQVNMVSDQGGTGLAFWVTDANSWWGIYPYYTSATSNVTTNQCAGPAPSNNTYNLPENMPPNGCGVSWIPWQSSVNAYCADGYAVASWPNVYTYCQIDPDQASVSDQYCLGQRGTNFAYGGGCYGQAYVTATVIPVTNTVTNYTSGVAIRNNSGVQHSNVFASSLNPVRSIAISTSGNTISYSAYSAANKGGSVIASSSITPSSPTKGTGVGVFNTASAHAQGSQVDSINVTVS
jgi:hypothetical protein